AHDLEPPGGSRHVARGRRPRRCALSRARIASAEGREMIARLRGRAVARTLDGMVLDVNGVGYLVAATPAALRAAEGGQDTTVETYLHVREDVLQLYGFADADERELFTQLLTVNG